MKYNRPTVWYTYVAFIIRKGKLHAVMYKSDELLGKEGLQPKLNIFVTEHNT